MSDCTCPQPYGRDLICPTHGDHNADGSLRCNLCYRDPCVCGAPAAAPPPGTPEHEKWDAFDHPCPRCGRYTGHAAGCVAPAAAPPPGTPASESRASDVLDALTDAKAFADWFFSRRPPFIEDDGERQEVKEAAEALSAKIDRALLSAGAEGEPGTPASEEDFERMESLIGTPHLPDSEDDDALSRVLAEARSAQRLREAWPPIDYRINDGVEEDHPLAIISRLRSRVEQLEAALREIESEIEDVHASAGDEWGADAAKMFSDVLMRVYNRCLSAAPKEDDDE